MEPSVEQAFALFGLSSTCRLSELRRRYRKLARRWHPDRCAGSPQLRNEATIRMAEMNAAYRVAEQHLRRGPFIRRSVADMQAREATATGHSSFVTRTPWFRAPWISEREAGLCTKLLVVVLLVTSVGEIARRLLPPEWELRLSGATVASIVLATGILWRRKKE